MKNLWTVFVMLACCTLHAQAQKPDLDGTWKLRVSKSSMGSDYMMPNYQFTKIIAIKGNSFSLTDIQVNASIVNIALPDSKTTNELKLDGTEQEQKMAGAFPNMPPATIKVSGEWQGATVFIQRPGQMFGGPMTLHQRYFLSEDGSQVIELVAQQGMSGDKEQRLVFEKIRC
jgi:hypothetical protein